MKHRLVENPIARSSFSFFALVKVVFLSTIIVLFCNASFAIYNVVSTRYYTIPQAPFLKVSSPPPRPTTTAITTTFQPSYLSLTSHLISPSSSHSPSNQASCPHPSHSLDSFPPPPPPPPPPPLPPPPPPSLSSTTTKITTHSTPPYLYPPIHLISPSSPTPQASVPRPSPSSNSSISYDNPASKLSLVSSSSASYQLNSLYSKANGIPKGCDVSKGEWIPDPTAPYYTNSTCWTIQEHQNCMKYGRPNLDFLKWRWKPDGCHLPLLEPIEFLEFMRGKNLAFIGDSLARNQMQSLMCLLSRVEYPEEMPSSGDNITQMFYPEHNFTIWTFWSPFLIRAEESATKYKFSMWDLYLDEADPLWQPYLGRFDYIILNTGNWYTRPAHFHDKRNLLGCHYCVLKKVPFVSVYKAHRRAFRTALDTIVDNRQGFRGLTVVRTVSPSHFEGGEWNKGGDCKRTSPMRRGEWKMKGMDLELYKDQLREFWKAKWEGSEKGLDFRLLDTTGAMLLRPDGHPSKYGHWPHEKRVLYNDCVHWCLPGPVDMWNDFLFQVMLT